MAQQPALQRAHNPVKWYTWGEEAFAEARRREVPIFLFIGYSTSYRTHVMEAKSFEDEGIAEYLNKWFVNIKVDREERPDINKIYSTYAKSIFGNGGYPLSVFLSPTDLKPFMGGSYLLPDDKNGIPGFRTTIKKVMDSWDKNRSILLKDAGALSASATPGKVTDETLRFVPRLCAEQLSKRYDSENGGFIHSRDLKFPSPDRLQLMLYWSKKLEEAVKLKDSEEALEMVLFSLRCMAKGGIHDHIGGGFHRCTLDRFWNAPCFEKILCDQGKLANVYLDAFSITRDAFYSRVSRQILDYLKRDMCGPEGEFFSAEGAEGVDYFLWTSEELEDILGDSATLFKNHYCVKPSVNWERIQNRVRNFNQKNVLVEISHTTEMLRNTTELNAIFAVLDYVDVLGECREKVYHERLKRPGLHKDKKIIVSWNGLAISSFARASKILKGEAEGGEAEGVPDEENDAAKYMVYAKEAASFIKRKLYNERTRRLKHSFSIEPSEVPGFLDDYAYLISGLLDVYEFGGQTEWLIWATELQDTQDELFLDKEGGGYFTTNEEHPSVPVHMKEDYGGASGNSVSAINLVRLSALVPGSNSDRYRQNAENLLAFFVTKLQGKVKDLPLMCCAADMLSALAQKRKKVVLLGFKCVYPEQFEKLFVEAHADYEPNITVIHIDPSDKEEMQFGERNNVPMAVRARFISDKDKVTAHVYENGTWHSLVSDPELVRRYLSQKSFSSSTSTRATQ